MLDIMDRPQDPKGRFKWLPLGCPIPLVCFSLPGVFSCCCRCSKPSTRQRDGIVELYSQPCVCPPRGVEGARMFLLKNAPPLLAESMAISGHGFYKPCLLAFQILFFCFFFFRLWSSVVGPHSCWSIGLRATGGPCVGKSNKIRRGRQNRPDSSLLFCRSTLEVGMCCFLTSNRLHHLR
ncbi:hypothetical protein LY78DRAFT_35242 [Colletotrichum sublineola]|nr:hypothetical protein LY78DRAFT_35242 [Colletotrichum sublineola]